VRNQSLTKPSSSGVSTRASRAPNLAQADSPDPPSRILGEGISSHWPIAVSYHGTGRRKTGERHWIW